MGVEFAGVVASTDLEVDLEDTEKERKRQGVALVSVGGETKVYHELLARSKTSDVVSSGAGDGLSQTQNVKGRVVTSESEGLAVGHSKKFSEVKLRLLSERHTARSIDVFQLGPLDVLQTDCTVVGHSSSKAGESDQSLVTVGLLNRDLTIVLENRQSVKIDLREELRVRGTGPKLTVVPEVLDINVKLTNVVSLSQVERDLTVVVEVGALLLVVHSPQVLGGDVELTSVVHNTVVGDLRNVKESQEHVGVDVQVLEVHGSEVLVDSVFPDIETVSGGQ